MNLLIRPTHIHASTIRETFKNYDTLFIDKTSYNLDCAIRTINSFGTRARNEKYVRAHVPEALTYTFNTKDNVNAFIDALQLDTELHYTLLSALEIQPEGFRIKYTLKDGKLLINEINEFHYKSEHYKEQCLTEEQRKKTKKPRKRTKQVIPVNIEQYAQDLLDQNLKQPLQIGLKKRA